MTITPETVQRARDILAALVGNSPFDPAAIDGIPLMSQSEKDCAKTWVSHHAIPLADGRVILDGEAASDWTADNWDADEIVALFPNQRQIGTILAALANWRRETGRADRINHAYATGDESFEPLDDGEIDALIREITDSRA